MWDRWGCYWDASLCECYWYRNRRGLWIGRCWFDPTNSNSPSANMFQKRVQESGYHNIRYFRLLLKNFVKTFFFLSFFLVKECKPVTYEECEVEITEQSTETKCQNYTTTKIEQECRNKTEETCRQDFEYICHEYKKPHYGYPKPKPKPIGNLNSLFLFLYQTENW